MLFADPGECRAGGGVWRDPYTGLTFSNSRDLDIDPMVLLGNAHGSGSPPGDAGDVRRLRVGLTKLLDPGAVG